MRKLRDTGFCLFVCLFVVYVLGLDFLKLGLKGILLPQSA